MSVEHVIVDKIEKRDVCRPSVTGHIISHLLEAMDQYPGDQKFKLVLVPIYELEHGKEIEARQAQPSFSIKAIASQMKPISKDPETTSNMEKLARRCWCTSCDAAVMPSHRAEQEQKAKEKAELQAICQELKKFAEDHPEITAHLTQPNHFDGDLLLEEKL